MFHMDPVCQMSHVFDIKMWWLGGRWPFPAMFTYTSVVMHETVCIAVILAALNLLDMMAAIIFNAYIPASWKEMIFWPHLVSNLEKWKEVIIVRVLYGMKFAGHAFREHLVYCICSLGYKSCLANPDLWYMVCAWVEDDGGSDSYYFYVLGYMDNILCVHEDPDSVLKVVNKHFSLKPDSVRTHIINLGAKLNSYRSRMASRCGSSVPPSM